MLLRSRRPHQLRLLARMSKNQLRPKALKQKKPKKKTLTVKTLTRIRTKRILPRPKSTSLKTRSPKKRRPSNEPPTRSRRKAGGHEYHFEPDGRVRRVGQYAHRQ